MVFFSKGDAMKLRYALVTLAAATFSAGAAAQNMKPGLWEVTNNMKSTSAEGDKARAQAQAEMAKMAPAERKMMEEMMAKRGLKMGPGGPGGMTAKICLTKEQVERNEMPAQKGDCKNTKQQRSGNTMKFAYTCTNPPSTGEGQVTYVSSEAYTMTMAIKSAGRPEMNMEASGKWLSAQCGDVKPVQPPAK